MAENCFFHLEDGAASIEVSKKWCEIFIEIYGDKKIEILASLSFDSFVV